MERELLADTDRKKMRSITLSDNELIKIAKLTGSPSLTKGIRLMMMEIEYKWNREKDPLCCLCTKEVAFDEHLDNSFY